MYLGLYQGAAALTGLEKWQTLISQNLANASVSGYKAASVSMNGERMGAATQTDFGQVLQNTMLNAKPTPDFSQGEVVPSDNPLDVAIDGDGFFEVEQPDGKTLYSRDGQFHLNADNVLVNKANKPVKGTGGDLQFVPGAGEPKIMPDGKVFQGLNEVGQLSVVSIKNKDALDTAAGGFVVRDGQDAQITPKDDPRVLQGYYETSNVSPVREMVSLIAVTRAFEANQKAIEAQDQAMQKATAAFAPM